MLFAGSSLPPPGTGVPRRGGGHLCLLVFGDCVSLAIFPAHLWQSLSNAAIRVKQLPLSRGNYLNSTIGNFNSGFIVNRV